MKRPLQHLTSLAIGIALLSACQRTPPPEQEVGTPSPTASTPPATPETTAPATPAAPAPAAPTGTVVTPDNFVRAETDRYFGNLVKEAGGLGKVLHHREPASVDNQSVIRLNRDTLYSSAVVDLDAGPVTVTLSDAGDRFQSLMFVNEDHYAQTEYGKGEHQLTRDKAGTRYAVVGVRTLVDPGNPADVDEVHRLQDAIVVKQTGGPGTLELPEWDDASRTKVRDALLALAATSPDFKGAFGTKQTTDPVRHLIGTAAGWGGNPDKDAMYLGVTPERNDGSTVYRLHVKDVPVEAFWSVSVYNGKGYYEKNDLNAYSLNSITAKKEADGSTVIQFGGCDGKVPNCIPTPKDWNYTVRLYRPKAAALDGSWTFPAATPVS